MTRSERRAYIARHLRRADREASPDRIRDVPALAAFALALWAYDRLAAFARHAWRLLHGHTRLVVDARRER